jgi:hypothetical protein
MQREARLRRRSTWTHDQAEGDGAGANRVLAACPRGRSRRSGLAAGVIYLRARDPLRPPYFRRVRERAARDRAVGSPAGFAVVDHRARRGCTASAANGNGLDRGRGSSRFSAGPERTRRCRRGAGDAEPLARGGSRGRLSSAGAPRARRPRVGEHDVSPLERPTRSCSRQGTKRPWLHVAPPTPPSPGGGPRATCGWLPHDRKRPCPGLHRRWTHVPKGQSVSEHSTRFGPSTVRGASNEGVRPLRRSVPSRTATRNNASGP